MARRPALSVLAVLTGMCLHMTPLPSFAAPPAPAINQTRVTVPRSRGQVTTP
jgi:hypothetical protein